MNKLKLLLDFYIFFSVIVLAISIIVFLSTRNFNRKRIKTLGFFLDLSKSQCILLAVNTIHIIVALYCIFKSDNFGIVYVAMLIANCVIALICSLNLHYAIAEVVYDSITVGVLTLLNLINSYLNDVSDDITIKVLSIVFSIGIIVYLMYATTRKIELLFKKA